MAMTRPPGLLGTPAQRQRERMEKIRRGLLSGPAPTTPTPAAAAVDPALGGERGADLRGSGRDVKDWDSISQWANDPGVRRDGWALADILTGPSLMRGGAAAFGYDPISHNLGVAQNTAAAAQAQQELDAAIEAHNAANAANSVTGLGNSGAWAGTGEKDGNMGAPGGFAGAGVDLADLAAAAGANIDTGIGASPYFKGGVVRRRGLLDPPGPDDTVIAAKSGERILNDAQWKKLTPETRKEIQAVFKATGAKK